MPSETRSPVKRTFSISPQASEAIDEYADENNMTKSQVVEDAVLKLVNGSFDESIEGKVEEIDAKMDRLLNTLESDAPTSGSETTHTHAPVHTDETHSEESDVESDGGTAAISSSTSSTATSTSPSQSISDPAVFDSLADYSPDYPTDYELSRDALREVPDADDIEIDPAHVDYDVLQSRGTRVAVKTAVCAAIIRHEISGAIKKDDVVDIATEVLGNKRNANRFFDDIVSNFHEPTDHPGIDESDISAAHCPPDVRRRLGCAEGVYAPSLDYVGRVYHEYWYSSLVDKVTDQLESEPDVSVVGKSQGPLKSLWENREEFEQYVTDLDDAESVYTKLLAQVLEVQDEVDCEIPFPDPAGDGEVTSTDDLDVELEAEHESED